MPPPKNEVSIEPGQWAELTGRLQTIEQRLAAVEGRLANAEAELREVGVSSGVFDVWHAKHTPDGVAYNVDLREPGTVHLDSIVGKELLAGVGCVVTEDVVGIPKTDLRFVDPQRANNTFVYDNANTFHEDVLALPHGGDGSKKGDWFFFPVGSRFKSGLTIEVETTDPAASGLLHLTTYGGFAP